MGWARGSELAEDVWCLVRDFIPKADRCQVARHVIDKFEDYDCDTIEEAEILCTDAERPVEEWDDDNHIPY